VPTGGCACIAREVTIDHVSYTVQFWDTAGQEIYQSIAPIYTRGAAGAMIVFDLTRRASFENITKWTRFVEDPLIKIVLVGNKCDLEGESQVRVDEGREAADRLGCHFFCTSARTGFGVEDAFLGLVKIAVEARSKPITGSIICDLAQPTEERNQTCC
jgi:small GTP-binding protein